MSTNDSTPNPTAGVRPCDGRSANVCVAEGCYGEACLRYPTPPADDASTPASEGLTKALLSVRAKVEGEALLYADEDGTMPLWNADDPDMHAVRDALLPWLAARVADAEAKARADERERIAQDIEAERDKWGARFPVPEGWDLEYILRRAGTHSGLGRAARIARGDA